MNWIPAFGPQCCDTQFYLETAQNCFKNSDCGSSFRPLGATYYHVLPLWLGLPANAVILLNWLLMALSVWLSIKAAKALWPSLHKISGLWLLSGAIHAVFMYGDSCTALTDVGAACFALIALWSLLLGARSRNLGWHLLAGLCLGAAALIRVFYLYPALVLIGSLFFFQWITRRPWRQLIIITLGLSVLLFVQYSHTYKYTGKLAFSNEDINSHVAELHKRSPYWGYDTGLNPARAIPYDGSSYLKNPNNGFYYSLFQGDPIGAFELAVKRQQFYFGSYASHTYLLHPEDRKFSNLLLVASFILIVLAIVATLGSELWLTLPVFIYVGAIWALATAIEPEFRFLFVFYIPLWLAGPLFLLQRWLKPSSELASPTPTQSPFVPKVSGRSKATPLAVPAQVKPQAPSHAWGLSERPTRKPAKKKPSKKKRK